MAVVLYRGLSGRITFLLFLAKNMSFIDMLQLHNKFELLKKKHEDEKRKMEDKKRALEQEINVFNMKKEAVAQQSATLGSKHRASKR